MEILKNNQRLYDWIVSIEMSGYTVNLEYVTPKPEHRIVVHYPEPSLMVLNARHRMRGDYMSPTAIPSAIFVGTVPFSKLEELDNDLAKAIMELKEKQE